MISKLPVWYKVASKEKSIPVIDGVPAFTWTAVQNKKCIGEGSYGEVLVGTFGDDEIVVKKIIAIKPEVKKTVYERNNNPKRPQMW